ncbi:hypothetical protein [Dyadobacter sp.]|uniref:hypothetical protein n=1 Tax=Dyadobacter sp. TaxID=1914288 RepID=UPI0032649902
MGKSVSSAQESQEKKRENITKKDRLTDVFYVKTLVDEDTTKWIAKDVPIDLDRLLAESKIVR